MASTSTGLVVILWTSVCLAANDVILTWHNSNTTHRYHLLSRDGITWSNSLDLCKTSFPNGRLAVVNDIKTLDSLQRNIQVKKWFWNNNGEIANELTWLGGRRTKELSDWTWLGGRDIISTETVLASGQGRCLSRSVHGSGGHVLSQRSCVSQMGQFLCSLPTAVCASHAPDQDHVTHLPAGNCLVVCSSVTKEYTWHEARNYCVLLGGDLAAEDSSNWTDYEHSGALWVGAWKQPWQWANQQDIRYTRWMPSHPRDNNDQACLATTVDGWVAVNCDTPINHLLCEELSASRPPEDDSDTEYDPDDGVPDLHDTYIENATDSPGTTTAVRTNDPSIVSVIASVGKPTTVGNVGANTTHPDTETPPGQKKTQHITVNSNIVHNHSYTSVITGVCGFLAGALLTVIVVYVLRKLTKLKSATPVPGQQQSHAHSLSTVPGQPQSPVLSLTAVPGQPQSPVPSLTAVRRLHTYTMTPTNDAQCHLSMTKL